MVQITNSLNGGSSAHATSPSDFLRGFGEKPVVTLEPASGISVDILRSLLVAEMSELFMRGQLKGWYVYKGPFQGGDEGSAGEGLSQFLQVQFRIANGLPVTPPAGLTRLRRIG